MSRSLPPLVRRLAALVMREHYPGHKTVAEWYAEVCRRTARLVVPPEGANLGVDYVLDLANGGDYELDPNTGALEEVDALPPVCWRSR